MASPRLELNRAWGFFVDELPLYSGFASKDKATPSRAFRQYNYIIGDNSHDLYTTLDGGDHGQEDESGGTGVGGGATNDARGTGGIEDGTGA